jgi:nitrile hydratase
MPVLTADRAREAVLRTRSKRSEAKAAPKFKPGDRVVVMNRHPEGHTRAPRFIRGKTGVIHLDHGVFPYPDTNAHGLGEHAQHVYSVRFEARGVWGPEAAARDGIYLDLWDDYLERA